MTANFDVSFDVQWSPHPQDWLWPAVLAFSDALTNCEHPGGSFQGCQITFVLCPLERGDRESQALDNRDSCTRHNSSAKSSFLFTSGHTSSSQAFQATSTSQFNVTSSSGARCGLYESELSAGGATKSVLRRPEVGNGNHTRNLVAVRPLRLVDEKPVLVTRIGQFLARRKLLKPFFVCTMMVAILLLLLQPGKRTLTLVDASGRDVDEVIEGNLAISMIAVMYALLFLTALHFMSVGLFWLSLQTFEGWLLIVNQTMLTCARVYNTIQLLNSVGEMDTSWIVAESLRSSAYLVMMTIFSLADALVVSRCWKLVCLSLYAVLGIQLYVRVRFLDSMVWTSHEICWYNGCASPKFLFQLSVFNVMVFVAKYLLFFLRGREFVFLSSTYEECCTREEAYILLSSFVDRRDDTLRPEDDTKRISLSHYLAVDAKATAPSQPKVIGSRTLQLQASNIIWNAPDVAAESDLPIGMPSDVQGSGIHEVGCASPDDLDRVSDRVFSGSSHCVGSKFHL